MKALVSPAVEAARARTSQTLAKQFSQATDDARQQFIQLLEKLSRGGGNTGAPFLTATATTAEEPVAEAANEWFDGTVLTLMKEREGKFYELMTTAFRGELHRQVRGWGGVRCAHRGVRCCPRAAPRCAVQSLPSPSPSPSPPPRHRGACA
jgi:hypothetical protein